MASRRFYQFMNSLNPALTLIQGSFSVGSSGAVSAVNGSGIYGVTRLAAGIYEVRLQDNYFRYLGHNCQLRSSSTGTTAIGSISPGTVYQIAALGAATTAQWVTAGVPVGVTPAVGLPFLCAATSAGSGSTCATAVSSGVENIEVMGNPQTSITSTSYPYLVIRCLGPTATADTAMIPVDPASGSKLDLEFLFRNSSILGYGET
jgi:hypothetical protein